MSQRKDRSRQQILGHLGLYLRKEKRKEGRKKKSYILKLKTKVGSKLTDMKSCCLYSKRHCISI